MSTLSDGRYSLAEVLGEGGMATVYRAYDERLQVWRALKLLSQELSDDPSLRERFLTEARAMARLSHPHIVAVHDVRPEGSRPFIVMEWVGGGDLAAHVRRFGPLPPRQAVEVLVAVLDALEAAHEAGVIHRDIKPQNVLISEKGQPKVADFGVARVAGAAKLTRTGSSMGTWAYMAPEQRAAGPIDHRVDIYAVGATLYLMLTGEQPVDLFASGLDEELVASVEPALRGVVRKACAYKPDERYATAEEMQSALLSLVETLPPLPEGCPPLGGLAERPAEAPVGGGTLIPEGLGGARTRIPEALGGQTLIPGDPSGRTLVPDGATVIPASKPSLTLVPDGPLPEELEAAAPDEADEQVEASAAAPSGVKADTLESHDFFGEPEAEEEDWDPGAGRWRLALGLVLLLLVAAVLAWGPWEAPPEPTPTVVVEEPTPPEPPVAPEPVVPEPEPSVVAPEVAEVPTAPSQSRPKPAPTPPAEPSTGTVQVTGDAKLVRLEAADGTRVTPGEVEAGRYTIYASFDAGAPVAAGKLELAVGERVTLRCDARFALCQVKR